MKKMKILSFEKDDNYPGYETDKDFLGYKKMKIISL